MLQLACFVDGGLCIVAFFGVSGLLGWLGIRKLKATDHPHEDCGDCNSTRSVERAQSMHSTGSNDVDDE
jgi:hypothetical protein